MVSKDHWVYCRSIVKDIIDIANECGDPIIGGYNGAKDFDTHYIGLGKDNC